MQQSKIETNGKTQYAWAVPVPRGCGYVHATTNGGCGFVVIWAESAPEVEEEWDGSSLIFKGLPCKILNQYEDGICTVKTRFRVFTAIEN